MRSAALLRSCEKTCVLDLVDVLPEPLDRGRVVVDDAVDDRVQHGPGAVPQQVGLLLERAPHAVQLARLAVADGDDVVVAEEDQDLAELDDLASGPRSGRS